MRDLLADFVQNGSEAAFRRLVERYTNLVYSRCLAGNEGRTMEKLKMKRAGGTVVIPSSGCAGEAPASNPCACPHRAILPLCTSSPGHRPA